MAGVRTPSRQFSSCVLIECGDSLDSISATTSAIVKYALCAPVLGIYAGRIRAVGSPIRGGEAQHTGCIPFFKLFQAAVNLLDKVVCVVVLPHSSTRCGTWKLNLYWF